MPSTSAILLNAADNVFVLPDGGAKGGLAEGVNLLEDIPPGHKIARVDVAEGAEIVKYGVPIGRARRMIVKGAWVHEHNVATRLGGEDALPRKFGRGAALGLPEKKEGEARTFLGFERPWGLPGVRNDIWVIPTVGCIGGELRYVLRDFKKPPWIDEVRLLEHPYGCSQLGSDLAATRDILCGLAQSPNAAGVLLVGLGCENLPVDALAERVREQCPARPFETLNLQDASEEAVLDVLRKITGEGPRERKPFPISDLCVGVKCGGSDGYSGLTANPLVGRFSDFLTAAGGTILATEIPEMFGAEGVITDRIADDKVFCDFLELDEWFRAYFRRYGQPIFENPSPGNRAGGISTLEEKSLGAVEKTGSAPVTRVLRYGERIGSEGGVQIVFSPGNDLVSCTALAGSGAQIVLFTTGRGTPFGTVVPTLKIAAGTRLAEGKPGWIDFDAGMLLAGESWMNAAERLIEYVIEVASGKHAAHERKGFGEIAIFKDGVIM